MPTFEYEATHDDGRTVRDTAFGASLEEVVQNLALKGLLVTKINQAGSFDPIPESFSGYSAATAIAPQPAPTTTEVPASEALKTEAIRTVAPKGQEISGNPRGYLSAHVWGPLAGEVPLIALSGFFRQFAAMMGAGVPLVTSLETLSKHSQSAKLTRIILEMRDNTQRGLPMSDAIQRYPEVFPSLTVSMIRAGEEGGFMQKASALNADYFDQEIELRNLYRRETAYPKLVVVASIVIISAANMIIKSLGKTGGIYSPLTDPAVMLVLVPGLIAWLVLMKVGLANPRVRYNWDLVLLKIPYLGTTLHQFAMAKFGRALGALYKGGVSVPRSIQLAADACGNEFLRSQIYPAATKLESGAGLAETLQATSAFSPLVLDMVSTGEMTGSLDGMLDKISSFYEGEAKVRAEQLGRVTGVFAFLCVAIYVGFVVISFFAGQLAQIGRAGGE